MNLQIVLNTPKNHYLNQATPKNYLPNFPTQKNLGIDNFNPPPPKKKKKKKIQSSPSIEIWSNPSWEQH